MHLTVVTYNLRLGGVDNPCLAGGNTDDHRWRAQVDLLAAQHADIVVLTEAQHWDIDDRARLYATANALDLQPLLAPSGLHECHVAVLYRWPRVRCEAFDQDAAHGRFQHTLARALFQVTGGGTIEVLATHLDPFSPQTRLTEAGRLIEYTSPGRRALVMGDLNTVGADDPEPDWARIPGHRHARLRSVGPDGSFGTVDRRAMRVLTAAGFVDPGAGTAAPTFGYWGDDGCERRSDYVLVSAALAPAVASYATVDGPQVRELSDHLPVVVTLDPERA